MITVKRPFQGYTVYRISSGPVCVEVESTPQGEVLVSYTGFKHIVSELVAKHHFKITSENKPEHDKPILKAKPIQKKKEVASINLDSLTVAKLREKAKLKGITGYTKMKKSDIIKALS